MVPLSEAAISRGLACRPEPENAPSPSVADELGCDLVLPFALINLLRAAEGRLSFQ